MTAPMVPAGAVPRCWISEGGFLRFGCRDCNDHDGQELSQAGMAWHLRERHSYPRDIIAASLTWAAYHGGPEARR